jgi:hypothetical protein
VIPAGGSGTLTAKIKTTSTQNGPVSKSISVTTDALGAERLLLNVRFAAVSLVAVLPRAQLHLRGVEGDTAAASVVLRRGDGEPIEVTKIDNTDERIEITFEPVTKERKVGRQQARVGDVVLTAKTAPGIGAVMENGRFRVRTNHPDAAPVDLVYSIRMLPVIEARPQQVRLLLQRGNDPARTALLRLQHNRRDQFRITGTEVSSPELIEVNLVDGDVRQQVHTVAIMLGEGVEAGSLDGRRFATVTLLTDDPGQPSVEVSVQIEPRDMRRPGQPAPAG